MAAKQTTTLHNRLAKIQLELKAPKGQTNKFGGYKYRSCEDILNAVKKLLKDETITTTDEVVQIGERYYIKATAVFSDGKEEISKTAYARESKVKKGMDSSQITGSSSSYARKYALNGLFAIDDAQDADTTDNREGAKTTKGATTTAKSGVKKAPVASEKQKKMIFALCKQAEVETDKIKDLVKKKYSLESYNDINVAQASAVIDYLQKLIKEKEKEEDQSAGDEEFDISDEEMDQI